MPRVDPLPFWLGQSAYVIGGGPSLRGFNFTQLAGKHTIGCNHAYKLGKAICEIALFGDEPFWNSEKGGLAGFGGWVVTNKHLPVAPPWLRTYARADEGLCDDGKTLAWNYNTGALAVNLALTLGAGRVLLLGVDLANTHSATHWHHHATEQPNASHYTRFGGGFANVAAGLVSGLFPNSQVVNVVLEGEGALPMFPVKTFVEVGLCPPE